jgi:hypothetical protein
LRIISSISSFSNVTGIDPGIGIGTGGCGAIGLGSGGIIMQ